MFERVDVDRGGRLEYPCTVDMLLCLGCVFLGVGKFWGIWLSSDKLPLRNVAAFSI